MELVRQRVLSRIFYRRLAHIECNCGMAKRGASMGTVPCCSSSHRNFL